MLVPSLARIQLAGTEKSPEIDTPSNCYCFDPGGGWDEIFTWSKHLGFNVSLRHLNACAHARVRGSKSHPKDCEGTESDVLDSR